MNADGAASETTYEYIIEGDAGSRPYNLTPYHFSGGCAVPEYKHMQEVSGYLL